MTDPRGAARDAGPAVGRGQGWGRVVRMDPGRAHHVATVGGNGFTYAGTDGNFGGDGIAGYFVDDVRIVARAELRINGERPELVDSVIIDDDEAVFCVRLPVHSLLPGSDAAIVVLRHRWQDSELRDQLRVENHTGGTCEILVEVEIDSDLVPMTDLILGHATSGALRIEPIEQGIRTSRHDGSRWWACEATMTDAEVAGDTLRTACRSRPARCARSTSPSGRRRRRRPRHRGGQPEEARRRSLGSEPRPMPLGISGRRPETICGISASGRTVCRSSQPGCRAI